MTSIWRRPLFVLALLAGSANAQVQSKPIVWHPWSDEIFAQAAREHKFVLLTSKRSGATGVM